MIEKINVTNVLRDILRTKRIEKNLSGVELSQKINQTGSYISALENKRIQRIPITTLIEIVKLLFDLKSNDEAESKINELMAMNTSTDAIIENDVDDEQVNSDLEEKLSKRKIIKYNTFQNKNINTQINDVLELFKKVLEAVYKDEPEIISRILKAFPRDFAFDVGFMVAIFETPFFAFKNLSHDERQAYLNDFADLFNKYALISKNEELSKESDNDKGASEPSDPL